MDVKFSEVYRVFAEVSSTKTETSQRYKRDLSFIELKFNKTMTRDTKDELNCVASKFFTISKEFNENTRELIILNIPPII